MSIMPSCQACGGAISDRPATAARAPDGRATWWLHRDLADCWRIETHRASIVWRGKLKRVNKQELEECDEAR